MKAKTGEPYVRALGVEPKYQQTELGSEKY